MTLGAALVMGGIFFLNSNFPSTANLLFEGMIFTGTIMELLVWI